MFTVHAVSSHIDKLLDPSRSCVMPVAYLAEVIRRLTSCSRGASMMHRPLGSRTGRKRSDHLAQAILCDPALVIRSSAFLRIQSWSLIIGIFDLLTTATTASSIPRGSRPVSSLPKPCCVGLFIFRFVCVAMSRYSRRSKRMRIDRDGQVAFSLVTRSVLHGGHSGLRRARFDMLSEEPVPKQQI